MPGRNPHDAVDAFLAPLQQAASCLGACKLVIGPRASAFSVGDTKTWNLNGGRGISLRS